MVFAGFSRSNGSTVSHHVVFTPAIQEPGRELASLLEDRSFGNRGENGARAEDADASNGLEPLAIHVLAMLRARALLDHPNLCLATRRSAQQVQIGWQAHALGRRAALASANMAGEFHSKAVYGTPDCERVSCSADVII
jgi:hypothetical protein